VYNDAIDVARSWGYAVVAEEDLQGETTWIATKEDFVFYAYNPIELLGLIAIHVRRAPLKAEPYWWSRTRERSAQDLTDAASREAAKAQQLSRDPDGYHRVQVALEQSSWNLSQAARLLEITPSHMMMLLDLPRFSDLQDRIGEE
jgi:hypothetical protein